MIGQSSKLAEAVPEEWYSHLELKYTQLWHSIIEIY